MSLAQKVALLSSSAREEVLAGMDLEMLQYDWKFWARPSQYIDMSVRQPRVLLLGGRGAGKTRGGCEWTRDKAKTMPGSRGLLVARTAADVRDVLVNGESGILNIHPPSELPTWEPSKRLLTWPNGTTALVYSAEIPDALRGIQSHWSLADEIGTWDSTPDSSGLTAWDNLVLATRLGDFPQVLAMTTPRRTKVIKDLLAQAEEDSSKVLVRRSRTADNRGNLSMAYLDAVVAIYEGTVLAAQELDGQMLDDVEGALWTSDLLDAHRLAALPSEMFKPFVVIGVDPSVAENPRDEAGIVVVVGTSQPRLADRHAYVVEDSSLHGSPDMWAEKVAQVARKWGAPVVAEVNQGGALIKNALTGVDPSIRVVPVHARVGKALRAEPVVLASQQGRVHMVGEHALLEDQLCLVAGTLIETRRGHIPIECVVPSDEVMTRLGWAPVEWSGETHRAGMLTAVCHDAGGILATPWHRVWTQNRGFVPATFVQRSDLLVVRPSPARMENLLRGAAGGSIGCPLVITETMRELALLGSYTGRYGSLITDPSLMDTSFTTSTMTRATTNSTTLNFSSTLTIDRIMSDMLREDSLSGRLSNALRTHGVPGASASPVTFVVTTAAQCSRAQGCEHGSAHGSAGGNSQVGEPVYDIQVADGYLHEFFANGVLVHNTTWQPELSKKSPDRLDAMVYAALAVLTEETKKVGRSPLRVTSRARSTANSRLPASSRAPGFAARSSRGEDLRVLPPHMRRAVAGIRWN